MITKQIKVRYKKETVSMENKHPAFFKYFVTRILKLFDAGIHQKARFKRLDFVVVEVVFFVLGVFLDVFGHNLTYFEKSVLRNGSCA